jgi:hypothetical protein
MFLSQCSDLSFEMSLKVLTVLIKNKLSLSNNYKL